MESIFIKCGNCDRITGLILKVETVKEMSTRFVLNTKWHHVDLSWIISSSKQINYFIKKKNNPDWLNNGPRYNKAKMLGLNSFITITKIEKKGSRSYDFFQTNTNYEIQTTYSR